MHSLSITSTAIWVSLRPQLSSFTQKRKECSIYKNKSKLSDSPIFHFYSMDMSILCALISVLASLEIFVNFTLRCTYNKEKPRLFHRNRPDKIKGNHQYISAHGGFLVNLNNSWEIYCYYIYHPGFCGNNCGFL